MSEEKTKNTVEEVKPTLDDVPNVEEITEDDSDNTDNSNDRGKRRRRRRVILNLKCPLCESGVKSVSYKDVYQLKKFTSVRGKIISTEKSGVCHKHQNQITRAIKRARFLALLPYVAKDE